MSCQQQRLVSNLFADCDSHLWGELASQSGQLLERSFSSNHVVDVEIMPVASPPWLPDFLAICGMHQLAASDAYTP